MAQDIAQAAHNIADLRDLAKKRLPRLVFEFIDRGAEDEVTLRANRAAFERLAFAPRVLRNVQKIELSTPLLGRDAALPLLVAPIGGASAVWPEGEVALARAAADAGVPFMISSASTTPIEKIIEAGGRQWFQLYPREDPGLTAAAIDKAQALGCETLVVTVDTAKTPNREYNRRNGYANPLKVGARNALDVAAHPAWMFDVLLNPANDGFRQAMTQPAPKGSAFVCDAITWEDIAALRKTWRGLLVIKGIVSPADADLAVRAGVDAIVVSNHGARNLDGTVATMEALPAVLAAVNGRIPVMVDSGVRRGADVVKALALGASAVIVGRAPLYGLAAAGKPGVDRALALLAQEITRVMGFCGCASIEDITPELIFWPAP